MEDKNKLEYSALDGALHIIYFKSNQRMKLAINKRSIQENWVQIHTKSTELF